MRDVVQEGDRKRNVMLFGLKEERGEDLEAKVADILMHIGEKPRVGECNRVGTGSSTSSLYRPVKVSFGSSDVALQILTKSNNLRTVSVYRTVYIEPDRSAEERMVHKQLVTELKQKIKEEPACFISLEITNYVVSTNLGQQNPRTM